MKLKKIALVLALVLLLPALLLAVGACLPTYYAESYYAQLPALWQNLREAEGKKLVVIGGSNVAFGLEGALLEDTLAQMGYDYTVCPFGLYAAVGTVTMLDLSLEALGEGDVVVLAFEPTSETLSTYFGATAFWKCAEEAPSLLLSLDKSRQAAIFGNYAAYLQERWAIFTSGQRPVIQGVYAKASFDSRGDMVYDRAGNTLPLGFDTTQAVDLEGVTIDPAFAREVQEYCAAAKARGAQVVLSFSPINRSALVGDGVLNYFTQCAASFGCPIISDPNRYILDSGWFYDSNFHLNTSGAKLRTLLLAEDLLAYLGCYQALDYEIPAMPASVAQRPTESQDLGHFTFAPLGEGWAVSGLTETGLTQENLAVPAWYEGKPVVEIQALASEALISLEIPATVAGLTDGQFADCPNLARVVLLHTEMPCDVTKNAFDGAGQVKIFVPRDAYPLYRDGYGCETSPWAPFLDRIETF